jgi:hypothetical protein
MITPEFDRGYLAALKRLKAEITAYSELITDVDDMDEDEIEIVGKVCYDIVDMISGEIANLEEF